MALARLSTIFILILQLKDIYGQQSGLGGTIGSMGCPQQALQRKSGLISNPSSFKQLSKPSQMGCTCNLNQQNSNSNLQQTGNLQQATKLQQPSNCPPSVQQQQNVQQSQLINQNLPQNVQQNVPQNLPLNLQQQNPLQNVQQNVPQNLPLNLQQQLFQQQQTIPLTNMQIVAQQPPTQTADISFSSFPIVNGQISGLPSQVSQGVLLSNLGLTSSLPSILPNSCNCQQQAEQTPMFVSQNNQSPASNMQMSFINRSQNTPASTASISVSQPVGYTNSDNPQQTSMMIPVSFQNTAAAQQAQQPMDLGQNSVMFLQNQPSQNQVAYNPVQLQQQPVTSVQNQPVINSIQGEPSLASFLLSQLQSPNITPQYSVPSAYPTNSMLSSQSNNQGSKSSSLKALLPLLFNLLKEKNSGCGCPQNFNNNCGHQNPNNNLANNNKNYCCKEPQISGGYSNLINYGRGNEDTSDNNIESEESTKSRQRRKYKKFKYRYDDDSAESLEADDAYDIENED